ncbi:phosphatidylglycerophosphatase A family protein [Ohtaekwangia sp.]|uniref:phosphatidylglycerophosphatase A family protein n=1 Tax=Ohtaekwangia sp. TaxID=2066019 RepID=UPI002F92F37C
MSRVHKIIASCFGIGHLKGGGTVAAAACCGALLLMPAGIDNGVMLLLSLIITDIGVWSASGVEGEWGKDSSRVVIDEVAGMCISVLFIPLTWVTIAVAFILFRAFDILKPLYIRRLEAVPGGWGVMLDDLAAGIYANIVMQIFVRYML